ncbi:type II secretion system GspH family protein [bacterium]|nr:type II secretion system GspH family protein [bacterium]MBU1882676.1 type II secretion system GspH family protein [bacterium]
MQKVEKLIRNNKKAFTLIEIVFVIVVLGILATIALPKFTATRDDAIEASVKKQITAIRTSIENERQARLQAFGALENNNTDSNLTLYYNYRPWLGETYLDGNKSVVMQNVDTFRFRAAGDLIKVQLCITDSNISRDGGYSICKEKTVF